MIKNEKIVDLDKLDKLSELVKLCLELTINQKNKISELDDCFLEVIEKEVKYVGPINDENKLIRYGININKLSNCLENKTKRNKIKACLDTINFTENMLIPIMFYKELQCYENMGNLNGTEDILNVLDKCFSIQKSKFKSKKEKDIASCFIASISDLIISKYKDNKSKSIPADYMYNNLSNILSSIKNKNYVILNDEEKFYNFLRLYYYINVSKERNIDVSSLMKENIEKYNNKISEEKNPVHRKAKKLYRYISRNSISKITYDKFPSFDDKYFNEIMSETRMYIDSDSKLDPTDLASKIAIIDCYKISYYKKKQ